MAFDKKIGIPFYLLTISALLLGAFSTWVYDDPFITYRYAQNLGNGLGFVYNPGERVLSTTTPLFAMLLAPFAALGIDLHLLANLFGAFSMSAGGLLLWNLSHTWQSPWVGRVGLLLYPTLGLVLSTTGSETPLYLALCLAAYAAYARQRYSLTALVCALATLARPDGILVPAILTAHFLITNLKTSQVFKTCEVWKAVLIYSSILLGWVIFAWAYFGSPIPVTLAAKQSQGAMAISQKFAVGLLYVLKGYNRWPYWLESGLAVAGFLYAVARQRRWLLFIAWPVLYFAAYTFLGVSRYFWYYAPLVPGFVGLVGLGFDGIESYRLKVESRRLTTVEGIPNLQPFGTLRSGLLTFNLLVWAVLVILFAFQLRGVWKMGANIDRRYAIYRAAGEWLKQNTPTGASVGMLEVGIIGYYAQRPVIDFAGLIQPEVARQMQGSTTYDDTALWAVEHYRPQYLVLSPGVMPRLDQKYVAIHCQPIQTFFASQYNALSDLVIYDCHE